MRYCHKWFTFTTSFNPLNHWTYEVGITMCMHARAQLYQTLCNPLDFGPPASYVHGISQVRTLEQVAILFSRGSPQPRDQTCISWVSCITGRFFTTEPSGKLSPFWKYENFGQNRVSKTCHIRLWLLQYFSSPNITGSGTEFQSIYQADKWMAGPSSLNHLVNAGANTLKSTASWL